MFKCILKYHPLFISLLFIVSCSSKTNEAVVAEANGKVLLLSEVNQIVPKGTSTKDSIILTEEYINKWIKTNLLLQKAEENLPPEQKNVSKELEAYRSSLIIYKYKNELVKQRMDTVVSFPEIEEYYKNHPINFKLSRSIIKAIFLKVPSDLAKPEQIRGLVSNTSDEGIDELREYSVKYAKKIELANDEWIDFQTIKNNFPVEIPTIDKLLKAKKLYEIENAGYYYVLNIVDYKLANELAPIEFVRNNIKDLILNQRKIKFLKDIEQNIYKEGIRKNKFKIYNSKLK